MTDETKTYSKEETIVVMCNGKSVLNADFDLLSQVSTFGLNMAYKWYYKNDWWPTYHGGFDYVNNDFFRDSHIKLMEDDTPIQKCFYVEKYKTKSSKFFHINLNREYDKRGGKWNDSENSFSNFYHFGNSGTNACSVSACLGYKNILLIGADNNYMNIYGNIEIRGGKHYMTETPEDNPLYWFNYYLEKGDICNVPNNHIYHTPWWPSFGTLAKENGVRVINCSDQTNPQSLKVFETGDINEEIKKVLS